MLWLKPSPVSTDARVLKLKKKPNKSSSQKNDCIQDLTLLTPRALHPITSKDAKAVK